MLRLDVVSPRAFPSCDIFSDFSLFLLTLTVWRNLSQTCCSMALKWNLKFFSWINRVMCFRKEDHRIKVPFLSHSIKGAYYQHDLWLFFVNLDHLARIVCVCFLHHKFNLYPPPFRTLKEVTMCRSGELSCPSIRGE